MDSSELRAACEMAGLECNSHMAGLGTGCALLYEHPALPAYAAELLVQRDEIVGCDVSEMDTKRVPYRYECEVLSGELEKHTGTGDTPAEAIIRACTAAIGGGK